ncbi:MAG: hypothetical protein K8S23_17120 [Candidatus Cloacimonetes bacterium]|nr:hypothetical protein [Candidatus Cloacimonadota bacterium]
MKKIYLILTLFVLSLVFLGAQEPVSVRSQALANVIDDDWDYIFDPIELNFISGTYFYTNLADFNSKFDLDTNDNWYDFNWDNENRAFLSELPLGIAFNNPFIKNLNHSFLLRLRNSTVSEPVIGGNGESQIENVEYNDVNNDGIYDNKTLSSMNYENYDIDNKVAFVFNNSIKLGKFVFGLKIASENSETIADEATNDMGIWNFGGFLNTVQEGNYGFGESEEIFLIDEDYTDYIYSENGDFQTTNENNNMRVALSAMKKINLKNLTPEFRFDLNFRKISNNRTETDDVYSGNYIQYTAPDSVNNQDIDQGSISDSFYSLTEESGFITNFGFSLKNMFSDDVARDNAGYWLIGYNFGILSGDYENSETSNLTTSESYIDADTPENNWIENTTEVVSLEDKGDLSGNISHFFTKVNLPLNNNVYFGLGANYNYNFLERKTNFYDTTISETEHIENIEFDTIEDIRISNNEKRSADRTYQKQNSIFRIPVGLEFKIPKADLTNNDKFGLRNFCFRIGTTFISQKIIENDKKQIIESIPNTTITENGEGDVDINISDNDYSSISTHSKEVSGKKIFTAGIGYEHSKNLNIDLGGTIDEQGDNYTIGLSFSLKK